MSPEQANNPFLVPPDSFEVDLGPTRDEHHFDGGHTPDVLELHGDEEIEIDLADVDLALGIDLDALDLDDVGIADALDALDRNGGVKR